MKYFNYRLINLCYVKASDTGGFRAASWEKALEEAKQAARHKTALCGGQWVLVELTLNEQYIGA